MHFFLQPATHVEITMEAANRSVSSATEPTTTAWVTAASAPLASTWMWMATAVLVRSWFGLSFWRWHRVMCCSWPRAIALSHYFTFCSPQDVFLGRHLSPLYTELCLSNMSISWDSSLIPHVGSPGAPFLLCLLPKIFVYLFNYAFEIP